MKATLGFERLAREEDVEAEPGRGRAGAGRYGDPAEPDFHGQIRSR
jgi:hypothetical protein